MTGSARDIDAVEEECCGDGDIVEGQFALFYSSATCIVPCGGFSRVVLPLLLGV